MFIGHQKIKKYFEQAIEKNQLAQCYLFVGPESVGKFTLAQWIAKNLLNSKESKLEISNHPDFLLIKPEIKQNKSAFKKKQSSSKNTKSIISIDQIRELKRKFFLSSFGGGRKVAVIDKVDQLTIVGQNTCLKLLEELDAQKNIIILITSSFSSVLPTIISRCQVINFGLVSRDEMKKIKDDDYLIDLSLGRPGQLVRIIKDQKQQNKYERYFHLWREISQKKYIWEKFKKGQELRQDSLAMEDLINVWLVINRRILINDVKEDNFEKVKNTARNLSLLIKTKKLLSKSGLNAKILLEDLILNLCFKK